MTCAISGTVRPRTRSSQSRLGLAFVLPFSSATIDAPLFRHRNSGHLSFLPVFKLDLGQTKHHSGDHSTDSVVKFNLLRDDHDADTLFAPRGSNPLGDTLAESPQLKRRNQRFNFRTAYPASPRSPTGGMVSCQDPSPLALCSQLSFHSEPVVMGESSRDWAA